MNRPPPRYWAIHAATASTILVFRRSPSKFFQLFLWRYDRDELDCGPLMHCRLYPERCDLSADGRSMLFYLSWTSGCYEVLAGLSPAPRLEPRSYWAEGNTYGRGYHFGDARSAHGFGEPFFIHDGQTWTSIRRNGDLTGVYARRGWSQLPDRAFRKPSPDGQTTLVMRACGALDEHAPFEVDLQEGSGPRERLAGVVWADWGTAGRILTLNEDGRLRLRGLRGGTVHAERSLGDPPPPSSAMTPFGPAFNDRRCPAPSGP